MKSTRVTQKDIAERAGVHRTTVSLVFKNHPGIPEATRNKVLAIAKKLGYVPDPMLSALAAYRMRSRPVTFHGCLAWLVNHQGSEFQWKKVKIYQEYFEGAEQRAMQHGYNLEVFDFNLRDVAPHRLASVLRARNVQGIILCPQPAPLKEILFPLDDFSIVTFGHSVLKPRLHIVAATQYRNAAMTVRHLRELGYRRIGYVVWKDFDQRTDHNYWAGYLVEASAMKGPLVPPLRADFWNGSILRAWYEKYRPDAIVTSDSLILNQLKLIGLKAPDDVGVACFSLPNVDENLTGVHENSLRIGAVAVDFLVGMLHRGERGVPDLPQRTLVEGNWIVGTTVKEQIASPQTRPGKNRPES